jgi:hypothetical protein
MSPVIPASIGKVIPFSIGKAPPFCVIGKVIPFSIGKAPPFCVDRIVCMHPLTETCSKRYAALKRCEFMQT